MSGDRRPIGNTKHKMTDHAKVDFSDLFTAVEIAATANRGRCLRATRRIARGEEIYNEAPMVVGPSQSDDLSCVVCSRCIKLKEGLPRSCQGCGMAVCGSDRAATCKEEATATMAHVDGGECEILAKISGNTKYANSVSQWLTVFRALRLKRTLRAAFDQLWKLEHHSEERKDCELMQQNKEKVAPVVRELLADSDVSATDILRCCGSLDSNAFRLDSAGGTRAIFDVSSMINHDCVPNCRVKFDAERRLHLIAKRDIDSGEELTITYCSPLLGTPARQEKLKRNKFFTCSCLRCSDPTEFGSHMSSLKCPKCKGGLLTLQSGTAYRCNGCKFNTTREKSDKFVQSIRQIHDKLLRPEQQEKDLRTSMEKRNRVAKMEEMLEKHSKLLPPSHYLMFELKIELINEYALVRSIKSADRRLELLDERIR